VILKAFWCYYSIVLLINTLYLVVVHCGLIRQFQQVCICKTPGGVLGSVRLGHSATLHSHASLHHIWAVCLCQSPALPLAEKGSVTQNQNLAKIRPLRPDRRAVLYAPFPDLFSRVFRQPCSTGCSKPRALGRFSSVGVPPCFPLTHREIQAAFGKAS
jgi:hypothetical protein